MSMAIFGSSAVVLLSVAWVIAGIAAFLYSLICIGKTASLTRGIIGLILAILIGPFYWVYWYFDPEYCRAHVTKQ